MEILRKIKKTFLIINFCVTCIPFFGQTKKIDSLLKIFKTTGTDTIKVKALNDLGRCFAKVNIDTAIILSNQALQIATKQNWQKGIGHSNRLLGDFNYIKGDFVASVEYLNKALKIWERINYKTGVAAVLGGLGNVYYSQGDYPKTLEYYFKQLKLFQEVSDFRMQIGPLSNIGSVYFSIGDYPKALEYYFKSLKIAQNFNDQVLIGSNYSNIGNIYCAQALYPKALEYYFKSLKIAEGNKDIHAQSSNLNNLASVYSYIGDHTKALENYFKALKLAEKLGSKNLIAELFCNIGSTYSEIKNYPKALEYSFKSLKIAEECGEKSIQINVLTNIGPIYNFLGNSDKALEFDFKAVKLAEELGEKRALTINLSNIGMVYTSLKKYNEAEKYLDRSLIIAKELESLNDLKQTELALSNLFQKKNRFDLAMEHFKLFIQYRDSIFNEENTKKNVQAEMNFDFAKKEGEAKAEQEKKDLKALEEKNKQNIILGSVCIVLLLVAVFSVFSYNRYKVTQRQKKIIELKELETQSQKHIIEEKHKEITDSINYAERIQRSFLATKQMLDENLEEYFVLFKPKDVVSGDFYWSASLNNGNFALATADSTGHGVPGAIMSLLNITSLEKAIETSSSPDEILNSTRKTIIERLKKDGSENGGKDGMDCSLISFDFKHKKLFIANANNPVWIMRNNSAPETLESSGETSVEVIEIKADKMPVGKHDKDQESFTLKSFDLQQGDVVYTLTDGFPDQFGGDKGKKFMSKNLRELLASNFHLPMQEQKIILEQAFKNWVGALEQVDDVTIIGIRL